MRGSAIILLFTGEAHDMHIDPQPSRANLKRLGRVQLQTPRLV